MWDRVRQILEMIRFSHTIFALPFALSAALMAWLSPTLDGNYIAFRGRDLLGILVCMVCARSAAMAVNRLVDRDVDARNPRTEKRHLPAGILSVKSVAFFALVMSLGFIGGTLLFLPNRLPLFLSVPVLGFLFGYSYAKRFTSLVHFWLGAALMLAPISAWIALRGAEVMQQPIDLLPAITLGCAVLLWVAGFDMIYASQDAAFDVNARLHSVPARLGVPGALRLAAACHFAMVGVLALLPLSGSLGGPSVPLGWCYWAALAVVGGLLLVEHALVKPENLSRVNVAFFHINALISIGLLVVIAVDLIWFHSR